MNRICNDLSNETFPSFRNPNDIPYAPTTATSIPESIISWAEAQTSNDYSSWIYFYPVANDYDGIDGIWENPEKALSILSKFAGVIGPILQPSSGCEEKTILYNVCRSRFFVNWLGKKGISCINSISWDKLWRYDVCFASVDKNSIISINTMEYNKSDYNERLKFETGLYSLANTLTPKELVVIGPEDPYLLNIVRMGIKVFCYNSECREGHELLIPPTSESCIRVDLTAQAIPFVGMAGIKLGSTIEEMRPVIDFKPCTFEDGITWYSYTFENEIALYFLKKTDCLFQITGLENYTGKLNGVSTRDLKEEDFKNGLIPGYVWDDDEETYENKKIGVVIEFTLDSAYYSVRTKEIAENEKELISIDSDI